MILITGPLRSTYTTTAVIAFFHPSAIQRYSPLSSRPSNEAPDAMPPAHLLPEMALLHRPNPRPRYI
jgi:hypothetical protein